MKNKVTKSLLASILSLVLCVSMAVGTTFAWFTDSVTSGKNKIVAGNLDIEVYHNSRVQTTEEKIDDLTDLFKDVTLWEPGAVSYENFTIKNVGNLAAKFNFNLNVAAKNTLNGKDLTDVIKVKVIDGGIPTQFDRTMAESYTDYVTIADFQKSGALAAANEGDTDEAKYGIVLYWAPTENDNDYNVNNGKTTSDGQPLYIDFGITVVATQNTVESDSFDSQYDALAEFPVVAVAKVEAGKPTTLSAYDKNNKLAANAVIPADAVSGADKIKMTIDEVDKPATVTLLTDQTALNLDVKFFSIAQNGTETQINDFGANIANVDLSANFDVSKSLDAVYHTHGGVTTQMTKAASAAAVVSGEYYYDSSTKMLTIGSSTFSPFTLVVSPMEVKIEKTGVAAQYMTLAEFRDSVNSGVSYAEKTAILQKDISLSGEWTPIGTSEHPYDGSFDGNNKTVTGLSISNASSEGTGFFGYVNNANNAITFKNLTLKDANVNLGTNAGKNVGIFMGYVLNTNKSITIENIDVIGNSSVNAKAHAGGIVGKIYASEAIVKDCDNAATVTCAGMYAGGIVAIASDTNQTIVFNNCKNTAAVSGSNSGGIVGRTGSKDVSFVGCTNSGNVSGTAVCGGIVGTAEGTLNLTIDAATVNTGAITGETKGSLIGYTYCYNSEKNDVTITRSGNTEYADTAELGLIGSFSVSKITINNAKLHTLYFTTSWKNVVKVNLNNTIVDAVNWYTESGEHGQAGQAHADDGEYFYLDGNSNSTVTSLNYTQKYAFYKNYYSFKNINNIGIVNSNEAPLTSVAWYE